jgi:hypothetical protein
VVLTTGLAACHFPGRPEPGPPLVVHNDASSGINVYLLARTGAAAVFVGQVGPGRSRTLHIRGTALGDTLSLEARPVDGSVVSKRDRIVLAPGATWQVP